MASVGGTERLEEGLAREVPRSFDHKSFMLQWNPVNRDTKGTRQNVRIIGVSVLSGFPDEKSRTHVLSMKRPWQAFFYGNKPF